MLYIPQHRLCIVRQKAFWGSERSRHWPSCLEGNIPFRLQFLFFRSASIPFGRGDLRIVGHNADSAPHLPLAKCNTAAVRAPVSRRAEPQACRESVLLRRAFSLLLGARTTPQHSRACESKFGRNEQILGAISHSHRGQGHLIEKREQRSCAAHIVKKSPQRARRAFAGLRRRGPKPSGATSSSAMRTRR